ncbi:MAG TPA: glycosyltransferase [Geobacteraceae bacterium]
MSSRRPLVSVCIPTCNSARYLRETLESIAAQTYDNLEVIISDNASSDDTIAVANEYGAKYGFKVCANAVNTGAFNNWNRLVDLAQGEYVVIYHSDDIYEPTIVEESVAFLEREPQAGLVGTLATVIDEAGRERYPVRLPTGVTAAALYGFPGVFRAVLGNGGDRIFLVTPSVMVRRRLYAELGPFDTSGRFGSAGDYEMWLRIAARHPVSVIPRPLMRYRVHEEQGSERELRRNVALPDIMAVLDAYAGFIDDPALVAEYERFRSWACLKTALKQNCRGEYERSRGTAAQIHAGRYRSLGVALILACRLHLNLRCWPGRPWPCRIPPEIS